MSLGIEAVDSIGQGFHVAQLFHDTYDAVDTLARFFQRGLALNEFCLWVVSEPISIDRATTALKEAVGDLGEFVDSRQLQVIGADDWYPKGAPFNALESLRLLFEKRNSSIQRGFDGIRLGQNLPWLDLEQWADFLTYEQITRRLIPAQKITMVCCYDLSRLGVPEVVDIVNSHSHVLCERRSTWELIENPTPRQQRSIRGTGYQSLGRLMGLSRERVRQLVVGKRTTSRKSSREAGAVAPPPLLRMGQAASRLGVSTTTLKRWTEDGVLPAYRIGKRGDRRFQVADIDSFAAQRLTG